MADDGADTEMGEAVMTQEELQAAEWPDTVFLKCVYSTLRGFVTRWEPVSFVSFEGSQVTVFGWCEEFVVSASELATWRYPPIVEPLKAAEPKIHQAVKPQRVEWTDDRVAVLQERLREAERLLKRVAEESCGCGAPLPGYFEILDFLEAEE